MNPHLKLAYDHGVQKALEDAGLVKVSKYLPGIKDPGLASGAALGALLGGVAINELDPQGSSVGLEDFTPDSLAKTLDLKPTREDYIARAGGTAAGAGIGAVLADDIIRAGGVQSRPARLLAALAGLAGGGYAGKEISSDMTKTVPETFGYGD